MYVCLLLNHAHAADINGVPITKDTGLTVGISHFLCFRFWQPVYYKVDDSSFLSDSTKNVAYGLLLPNMLDMLWPSRYLLVIPRSYSSILNFALLRNPFNSIFSLTLFIEICISSSNPVQTGINKVCQILMILQDRMRKMNFPYYKNLPKDETCEKIGDTNETKITVINTSDIFGCTSIMSLQ